MNRAADVALAGGSLLLASPVLALAALAIKLEDGGPVLYRQTRVGRDGVDFELLKLRTMVVGAETIGAGLSVDRGDSRITRAGRLLRKLSLDELPQFWNVVRGEMSVIGPRPTLRYQVEQYDERQRHRLDVRPGITGWAQVNGRAALPWADRIELDVWYVEHRSPVLDLKILARTPLALFRGTYKGDTGGWKLDCREEAAGESSGPLSRTHPGGYHPGRPFVVRAIWLLVEAIVLLNPVIVSYRLKRALLRLFGATIGEGVLIKPGLHVKYPWRLTVGDHCQLGERAWIDNMEDVVLASDVIVSQGAYLCTGNHNWADPTMPLAPRPIVVEHGAWIGAFAKVAPGTTIGAGSVLSLGAVALSDTERWGIYAGNPAVRVGRRNLNTVE